MPCKNDHQLGNHHEPGKDILSEYFPLYLAALSQQRKTAGIVFIAH